jgi:endoglucanase
MSCFLIPVPDVNVAEWVQSVQAAVTAIRGAGATSQYILMPGSTWSHASALPTEAGPALAKVTDSAGGTDKLIFDVHQYLDSDGSGQSTECTTDNTAVMSTLYSWLKSVGNRKAVSASRGCVRPTLTRSRAAPL